jgi:hypothetical protein
LKRSEISRSSAGTATAKSARRGQLRIGNDWHAISIIAQSQSNPLKAIAEFVENSIDARANHIVITRGKQRGAHYLRITDDGEGIRKNADGTPDFAYVATHICDSIKRELKRYGAAGIQGEFGIGLLSFWTVGEELAISSSAADGTLYEMRMKRGQPSFSIGKRRMMVPLGGTEVVVYPLLPGLRTLSGERLQNYLSLELRDRIRASGVRITIEDRIARNRYVVEPRIYSGQRLFEVERLVPAESHVELELYLTQQDQQNQVGLYRFGTRVLASIAELDCFAREPWTSGFLQGVVDARAIHLTPGNRLGIIHDEELERLQVALAPIEEMLQKMIAAQAQAIEEETSREVLKSVHKAFREALLSLPPEEYDWFDVNRARFRAASAEKQNGFAQAGAELDEGGEVLGEATRSQMSFFEHAGPLFSVKISPLSCVVRVGEQRTLRAIFRDSARRTIDRPLDCQWSVLEGGIAIENPFSNPVTVRAGSEPSLARVRVLARENDVEATAGAVITVTDSIIESAQQTTDIGRGIPSYTFEHLPGKLSRSWFDTEKNVVVINSGHRDFLFASRARALKLRYICRLFCKELVLHNFNGIASDALLERLIELSLYTEEHLK